MRIMIDEYVYEHITFSTIISQVHVKYIMHVLFKPVLKGVDSTLDIHVPEESMKGLNQSKTAPCINFVISDFYLTFLV
jgi:uncharacterized protein (UPF0254 family)